jgi:chemotaxis protein methyltransferase WspC
MKRSASRRERCFSPLRESMAIYSMLEQGLAAETGLSTDALDHRAVSRAVAHVARRLGIPAETLLERLQVHGAEWTLLVEELTVQESWFFRDRATFEHFAAFARERPAARSLRVLSAPCARGEEPYSIAMCLLETGLAAGQFQVDAVDISRPAVEAARAGLYTRNAFRKECGDRRGEYFEASGSSFQLSATVMNCVSFARENILDPAFGADRRPYDVIFCRNLLIYLTEDARSRVMQRLDTLLAPDGVLFTGASELGLFLSGGYRKVGGERAFGCQRTPPVTSLPVSRIRYRRPAPSAGPARSMPRETLVEARRLADAGDLAGALAICERLLGGSGRGADLYSLLGVIHQAAGREALARQHFERVLYLDPNHYETLVHMALLTEKLRDLEGARRLRQRAERVMESGSGGGR